ERFTPAFQAALSRYRVQVETAELLTVVDAVIVTAPDLVLLMGDAAKDGGAFVLQKLAGLSQNFTVPVVVLHDDSELDQKLSAFRHGATAVLPRSASVDATAAEVAKMAREIPEQGSESQGGLGETTLDEFVGALSRQLRSGLVSSLSGEGGVGEGPDSAELKLVLGRGRPLTEFLDQFVRRVRRHVVRAEPLRYELGGNPVAAEGSRSSASALKPAIHGMRVVLADDDTPRADAVAQELRSRGVTVVVTDLDPSPTRLQTLRQADPTVFVIGEAHAHDAGYELLRRVRRDSRLRWASLLVVRWEEIWAEERGAPTIQRLESTLAGLAEPERALLARAEARVAFDTRLETTGPARCLRTLERVPTPVRVFVQNQRVELTVDLSEGLVVGAEGRTREAEPRQLSGVSALSALLVLGSGRVRVEPVEQAAFANVMTPVEAAITMADAETPPISPSIPAAGTVSLHPPQGDAAPLRVPAAPRVAASAAEPPSSARGSVRPAPIVPVGIGATPLAAPRPGLAFAPPVPSRAVPRPSGSVAAAVPAKLPTAPAAPPPPPAHVALTGSTLPSPTFGARAPAAIAPSNFGVTPMAPPSAPAFETTIPATVTAPAALSAPAVGVTAPGGFLAPALPVAAPDSSSGGNLSMPPHERNPPAMTLSAGYGAGATTEAGQGSARAGGFDARWKTFAVWFAEQEKKLHGKRISGRVAAVLVGLGALQGLLIVLVYAGARWVLRPVAPPPAVARVLTSEMVPVAKAAAPEPKPDLKTAAPAVAPVAAATPRIEPLKSDGSGRDVPDCNTLLAADPPHEGFYPGAAHQAQRAGRNAIVRGDLAVAQTELCKAVHYNTQNAEMALELSLVLLLRRDGAEALPWARRAVELAPRNLGAKEALGDALARIGNETEARAAWLASARIDGSEQSQVRALVARSAKQADKALRHRDLVTAERSFRRAAVLEPKSQASQSGLAYVLIELEDAQAAVLWAQRGVDVAPRSSGARLVLGDALAKWGDKAGAVREWREASLLDPTNREASKRLRAAGN
ncbi:MAG TPA: tetratricopeptide repeat protein, partial [Polyangiaceae bacterium]|nr:tetratricopeptide repeat protein [Polyangiaceae bacterium]